MERWASDAICFLAVEIATDHFDFVLFTTLLVPDTGNRILSS
ncbi:hypothetical protein Mal65_10490 [Crateriforma conspicua]|nr:hypothetical protein Mal65_10490 [Crateriforma conspicua]